jgi:hypothetical protein
MFTGLTSSGLGISRFIAEPNARFASKLADTPISCGTPCSGVLAFVRRIVSQAATISSADGCFGPNRFRADNLAFMDSFGPGRLIGLLKRGNSVRLCGIDSHSPIMGYGSFADPHPGVTGASKLRSSIGSFKPVP